MKHTIIHTFCDWPDCAVTWIRDHPNEDQDTKSINFTISSASERGRKAKIPNILLCQTHLKELTDLRRTLLKTKVLDEEMI